MNTEHQPDPDLSQPTADSGTHAEGAPTSRGDRNPGTPPPDFAAAVAAIWSEILGVHPVGPDDEFFALGGDSMLAAEAAAAVRAELGVPATLRMVFEAPVVRDFAAALGPGPVAVEHGEAL